MHTILTDISRCLHLSASRWMMALRFFLISIPYVSAKSSTLLSNFSFSSVTFPILHSNSSIFFSSLFIWLISSAVCIRINSCRKPSWAYFSIYKIIVSDPPIPYFFLSALMLTPASNSETTCSLRVSLYLLYVFFILKYVYTYTINKEGISG